MLKVMKSGEVEEIPSKGEPIKVKEGDFYKPTPDEIYNLSILNKTGKIQEEERGLFSFKCVSRRSSGDSDWERLQFRDSQSSPRP